MNYLLTSIFWVSILRGVEAISAAWVWTLWCFSADKVSSSWIALALASSNSLKTKTNIKTKLYNAILVYTDVNVYDI